MDRYRNRIIATAVAAALASTGGALAQQPLPPSNPDRNAYFGDLHLHTSYSFDAYLLFGAKVDPDGAYRFAKGEPVEYLGDTFKRSTPPLDFLAVTDHSENIGVFNSLDDPNSTLSRSEVGAKVKAAGTKAFVTIVQLMASGKPLPGVDIGAEARSAWQREIDFANRNYQPGKFTTFIAYEWSSMPDGQNLHRNVIFRGDKAPNPFSSVDSNKPEDLWKFLTTARSQGFEAIAIPHNSNASNGLMFDWVDSYGKPIDQAYAETRASNEPLVEISQGKGASETLPELSRGDEFANFERYDHLLVSSLQNTSGGSYVRAGLGRGLELAQRTGGANPFKYGFVGASDFHNGLSDSAEGAYAGTFGAVNTKAPLEDLAVRTAGLKDLQATFAPLVKNLPAGPLSQTANDYETGSGNLTGVWAEQNTRESIFDALRRKETFATSGTRLKFRFFGGWDLKPALLKDTAWVHEAYAQGVPMGGDLPASGGKPGSAPRFAVWAAKDPDGANLDRVQVIKLWLKDGKYEEQVYDVAASNGRHIDAKTHRASDLKGTVDLKTATYTNTQGATELEAVWRDPAFDPKTSAVYYLRVLEIQTPRWSTIAAVKRGVPIPTKVPATLQERGWSSPIWYTPARAPQAGSGT